MNEFNRTVYYNWTHAVGMRYGFADCDSFGAGVVARDTWSGCLDAVDYMPQGSVIARHTTVHHPRLSVANRNVIDGRAAPGTCHD